MGLSSQLRLSSSRPGSGRTAPSPPWVPLAVGIPLDTKSFVSLLSLEQKVRNLFVGFFPLDRMKDPK